MQIIKIMEWISEEVLVYIFQQIQNYAQLAKCRLVCKQWNRVATDNIFWQKLGEVALRLLNRTGHHRYKKVIDWFYRLPSIINSSPHGGINSLVIFNMSDSIEDICYITYYPYQKQTVTGKYIWMEYGDLKITLRPCNSKWTYSKKEMTSILFHMSQLMNNTKMDLFKQSLAEKKFNELKKYKRLSLRGYWKTKGFHLTESLLYIYWGLFLMNKPTTAPLIFQLRYPYLCLPQNIAHDLPEI